NWVSRAIVSSRLLGFASRGMRGIPARSRDRLRDDAHSVCTYRHLVARCTARRSRSGRPASPKMRDVAKLLASAVGAKRAMLVRPEDTLGGPCADSTPHTLCSRLVLSRASSCVVSFHRFLHRLQHGGNREETRHSTFPPRKQDTQLSRQFSLPRA